MKRQRLAVTGIMFIALMILGLPARPAAALSQPQDQSKQPYTIPEYNAFQAARAETNPQARLKLLDDFVVKFPSSSLLQYVYQLYYQTYSDMKNYPKTMEYADKLLAMGDKVDASTQLGALQVRVQVFPLAYNAKAPDANDQLTKERDAALLGLQLLKAYAKPANSPLTDDQFAEQKKPGMVFFLGAAGFAQLQLKDYPGAIKSFKESLALNPSDAATSYRLGLAYLEMKPPQSLDGFWQVARAINLKIPRGSPTLISSTLIKSR
jgi:tetratricopeptide (TPR) repeat protein